MVLNRLKTFFIESKRVFRITKKPSAEELKTIVKITGLGILAIGLIGFLVQIMYQLLR